MQVGRKTIVVYPGRFQPMLPHHVEVMRQLAAQYGDEVYVGTTGKINPEQGSYFDFGEKKEIATTMYGINPDHIIEVKTSPYRDTEYREHFNDNDVLIFAVGEKDARERFPFNNLDGSGTNLKKNGEPSYMQPLKGHEDRLESMSKHAYVTVAPNVEVDGEVASASAFRKAFAGAQDDQHAKEVFEKFFGSYNESIFQLVNEKLRGPQQMDNQLNEMRKLAGLSLNESAPVDFGGDEDSGNDDEYTQDQPLPGRDVSLADILAELDQIEFSVANAAKQRETLDSFIDEYDFSDQQSAARSLAELVSNQQHLALVLASLAQVVSKGDLVSLYAERLAEELKDGTQMVGEELQFIKDFLVVAVKQGVLNAIVQGGEEQVDENEEPHHTDPVWEVTSSKHPETAPVRVHAKNKAEAVREARLKSPQIPWDQAKQVNEEDAIPRVELDESGPGHLQLFDTIGEMIGRAIEGLGVTDQLAEYLEEKGLGAGEPARERLYRSHPGFALFLDTLIETADIRVYTPAIRDELDSDDYVGESDEKPNSSVTNDYNKAIEALKNHSMIDRMKVENFNGMTILTYDYDGLVACALIPVEGHPGAYWDIQEWMPDDGEEPRYSVYNAFHDIDSFIDYHKETESEASDENLNAALEKYTFKPELNENQSSSKNDFDADLLRRLAGL